MAPRNSSFTNYIITPLAVIVILTYLRYQHDVLLFHTFAELFSVVVGVLMFVVVWSSRHFTQNNFLTFLGIGYFWIAVLDTFHTFTMTGMPLFNSDDFEITIHFWVYTRVLEAILLLSAFRFLKKSCNQLAIFILLGITSVVIVWLSFNLHEPKLMAEDGLTTSKIAAELFVIIVLSITIYLYYRHKKYFVLKVLNYMLASLSLTILAEVSFTLFNDIQGFPFFLGHVFKFLSFWMIYKAIIETTLQDPMTLMSKAYNSYDSIPHPSIVVDEKGLITRLNRASIELAQEPAEHLYGKHVHGFFHPANVTQEDCMLCQHITDGTGVNDELIYYQEHDRWFVFSSTVMEIGSKISGMVQSLYDVTKQKHIEQELENKEEQLRILFETTSTGLALCRMDGSLVKINDAFANIIGRTIEETLSLTYWEITPEKYTVQEEQQLKSLKETGHYGPYIKEYIHKSGHLVPVELKGSIFQQDGEQYIWSVVEDITERIDSERRLRRSEKMDAIGQLSGGIAHDFNNILGVILGNLEIIKVKATLDPEIQKYLASIKKAGQRAAKLTNQLLDYSRKKADQEELIHLGKITGQMRNLIERSLTPDIQVNLDIPEEQQFVELSPGDFQDALLNLIINARDAMQGRGELTISLHHAKLDESFCGDYTHTSPGEFIHLAVTDNGKGITEEELSHIFEPFFTTKDPGQGTGLGLSMVFGFMKRSRGIITCESIVGKGTTFNLFFPVSQKPAAKIRTAEPKILHKGNEQTILLVDDEESLLALTTEQLELLNYNVIPTTSAKEALQIVSERVDLDLLLTDIVMPGEMNGYELAEKAQKRNPELKLLLCSGYTSKEVEETKNIKLKHPVLQKPYSHNDLANVLRKILKG